MPPPDAGGPAGGSPGPRAFEVTLTSRMAEAEQAVRSALASEGFGVLTEIDVAGTLAAKLGVERPPLKILGACNPALAHRALGADPSVALLLPCNVVLSDVGGDHTQVSIADPRALLAMGGATEEVQAVAAVAAAALGRVRDQLARA